MNKPRLEITLFDDFGEPKATVCYNLNPRDEMEQIEIQPPCKTVGTFEECIYKRKARDYREVNFADIGYTLGKLMAQRLADMGGWHGEERKRKTNEQT